MARCPCGPLSPPILGQWPCRGRTAPRGAEDGVLSPHGGQRKAWGPPSWGQGGSEWADDPVVGKVRVEGRGDQGEWVATCAPPGDSRGPSKRSFSDRESHGPPHPDPDGDPRSRIRKFSVTGEFSRVGSGGSPGKRSAPRSPQPQQVLRVSLARQAPQA